METITIILIVIFTSVTYAAIPLTLTAQTGLSFTKVLDKNVFYPNEGNVKFSASLDGMADLPLWLKLHQKDAESDALLYGTPNMHNIETLKLEVIAWNKETYETMRKVMLITVVHFDATTVKHQLELHIVNKDITDLLNKNKEKLLSVVNQVWSNAEFMTVFQKPSDRNSGRKPLPGKKEGVYVTVGGRTVVPAVIKEVISNCSNFSADNKVAIVFVNAGYDIDWCSVREIVIDTDSIGKVVPDKNFEESDEYYPTILNTIEYKMQKEVLTFDVIYIFIPVILGISFIVVLTCIMCFNADKKQHGRKATKKDSSTRSSEVKESGNGFAYGQLNEELTNSRSGMPNILKKKDQVGVTNPPPYMVPPKHVSGQKTQDSKF